MPLQSFRSFGLEENALAVLKQKFDESKPDGLDLLTSVYGSAERCYRSYLRSGKASYDPEVAARNILHTLTFRKEQALDQYENHDAVHQAFESHPLRTRMPIGFSGVSTDGAVVGYAKLGSMNLREIAGESTLREFMSLYLESALRRQDESTRSRGVPCPGSCDVYDCKGVSTWQLLLDVKATRGTLGPVLSLGELHYPETLCRCYVINASSLFTGIWSVTKPFLSERTQKKVTISSSIPKELIAALGGAEALAIMMHAVPEADASTRSS